VTTLVQIWLVFQRAMRQSLRNPVWVIVGIVQPVLYLALFGPLLQPIIANTPGFPPGDAYQILVPALLIQLGMFGSLFAGFSLIQEYRSGVVERMRVTPVSRTALLLGRSMRDVVVLVVQGILLTVVALFFGLRAPVVGVLIALVIVAIVALATSAASYAMALQLKSEDALAPLLNTIVLPLLLLSGILLPMTLAPTWLFGLSRINPFVYIVDAERAVFLGSLTSGTVVVGILVGLVLSAVTVAWGVRTFQRESA
jgi:ABC-2 type transport system permease protein